jgi:hypothetical protein
MRGISSTPEGTVGCQGGLAMRNFRFPPQCTWGFALLWCRAVLSDIWLTTFRENLSVPVSVAKHSFSNKLPAAHFPEERRPQHSTKSRGRYVLLLCGSETSTSNIGPETSCLYILCFFSIPPSKCRNKASNYSEVFSFHTLFIASF